jgi:hypothetical protein
MGTASSAACSPHLPGGRCLELTEERVPPGPGDEEGAPTPHGPLGVLLRHDHLLRGRPAPNTRRPLPQPPRVCGATTSRSSAWRPTSSASRPVRQHRSSPSLFSSTWALDPIVGTGKKTRAKATKSWLSTRDRHQIVRGLQSMVSLASDIHGTARGVLCLSA